MTSQLSMFKLDVALLNGNPERLTLLPSSLVQDVRTKAQQAFGKKYLKLISAEKRALVDPDKTLEEAEIEDGECLTAVVLQPQLAATDAAFVLWCHGCSAIVTWGLAPNGGDSSAVQDQLKGVQQIQSTRYLGCWTLWWRQFGSSRSAQGCATDSIEYWICQIHSYLQCSALRPGTLVLGNCALSLS